MPRSRDREMVCRNSSGFLQRKVWCTDDADFDRLQLGCWNRVRGTRNRTRGRLPRSQRLKSQLQMDRRDE
jgi:hypothetical protein